jgi:hypothetical protein
MGMGPGAPLSVFEGGLLAASAKNLSGPLLSDDNKLRNIGNFNRYYPSCVDSQQFSIVNSINRPSWDKNVVVVDRIFSCHIFTTRPHGVVAVGS